MSFFAILFALLIEQVRPLSHANPVHTALRNWTLAVSRNFDAGKPQHGWVAWALAVGVPTLLTLAVHWALLALLGWPVAALWSIAVLYYTLGFRQFSHHFTAIRDALDGGDEALAREQLARWQQVDASELPRSEIVRHVIEYSVIAAHRYVFGVLVWFTVLAALGLGPAGAVLYRMSDFVGRYWHHKSALQVQPASPALQRAAARAWLAIDWLPARITALGFAVVGSFEDAIDSWRTHARTAPNDNDGVILAATSGAVNVRLGSVPPRAASAAAAAAASGMTAARSTASYDGVPGYDDASYGAAGYGAAGYAEAGYAEAGYADAGGDRRGPQSVDPLEAERRAAAADGRASALPGREPDLLHLRSIVGLVWRSVVMWMVLLALLTMARLIG